MGIGANSSNQSGSNFFSSNPLNLQNPDFQALAPQTGAGISALQNLNPTRAAPPNGNTISPYFSPFGNFSNPQTNPLVAPVTGAQQDLLNQSLGIAYNGPGTLNSLAAGTAGNAANFANSNPLAQAF